MLLRNADASKRKSSNTSVKSPYPAKTLSFAQPTRFPLKQVSVGVVATIFMLAITAAGQDRQGKPGSLGNGRVNKSENRYQSANRSSSRPAAGKQPTPSIAPPSGNASNTASTEPSGGSSSGRSILETAQPKPQSLLEKPAAMIAAKTSSESQSAGPLDNEKPSKSTTDQSIVVASEQEKNQVIAEGWDEPWACLFVTGRQHGYIEPCGCTGLENQKGGLNRRDTLLQSIKDRGWNVVPIDAGDQVRRFGSQSEMKYNKTAEALKLMGYQSIMYGPDDLQMGASGLLLTLTDKNGEFASPFVAANITILIPEAFERYKIIRVGNRKIGVTGVLGDDSIPQNLRAPGDITVTPAIASLKEVMPKLLEEKCDYYVLIAHASLAESTRIAQAVPEFNLVVTAGGYGEPLYKPEEIEGTKSKMVQVGVKGMYAGLIGLYDDPENPVRYQRVALSSQFEDSPRIMELFARYQKELENSGLAGLGIRPLSHPSTREFVGSEKCADCHSDAFEIWKNTPHAHATESIINPPGRGQVPRHFDPECLACHVTGWNIDPHGHYTPYTSGYLSLEKSPHLLGNGCENCHGPGKQHADAEAGDTKVTAEVLSRLREEMHLSLSSAQDKCLECHDIDNSPSFHKENAFDIYWEKIKH